MINQSANLYGLSTIKGPWTVARLKKHFSESSIRVAIQRNVLVESTTGIIQAVKGKTRLLENDLTPGETVVQMVDGHPVEMMVVKDESGNVRLVNPEDNGPQSEANRDELMTQEDLAGLDKLGVDPAETKKSFSSTPL